MLRLRNSDLPPEAQDAECLSYSARKRGERCVYCGPEIPFHQYSAIDALHLAGALSGPLVSPEEAERRAYICCMCPWNVPLDGCPSCVNFATRIFQMVKGQSTKYDERLGGCAGCGCSLVGAVWFRDKVVVNAPPHCWAKPAE